jgi:outer membrane lipoprotein-sorting protein
MTAVTADRRDVQFSFNDIQINQNIPDARFEYDSPPSSNNFDNFLYGAD